MKLKRSQTGIPIEGGKGARSTLLSIDLFSLDSCDKNSDGMTPPWLIDDEQNPEKIASLNELKKEFLNRLSPAQRDVYFKCLDEGMSLYEYAKRKGLHISTVWEIRNSIREKLFKLITEWQ